VKIKFRNISKLICLKDNTIELGGGRCADKPTPKIESKKRMR
jgi:hypothetical protein